MQRKDGSRPDANGGGGGDSGGKGDEGAAPSGQGTPSPARSRTTTDLLNDVDALVELLEDRIVSQLERRGLRFRDMF